ncbi:DUF6515 family protein [Microbulbifer taiwanensis]|uniref:DUF6515 family protein n=1 Tax=Microbulbifer taiwanensis TaxID=986746 RepID=A0ABW1YND3_9GAMM|nr:DUF6515 family protein [Microbulbifer taiwanensis]
MHHAIALLLSLAVSFAWAQDRLSTLPSDTSQLLVNGKTYYYSRGSFYRLGKGGYLRVEPPLGAKVPSVPGSSGTFTLRGDRYFVTSDGAFLLYDPQGDDFAVVTPPPGWRDYYRAPPQLRSLPAPQPAQRPEVMPRAQPQPDPRYRPDSYYGRSRADYYYRGDEYYGRYGFRDDIYDESYRERRATCRRIASDQSRRAGVGPYRRQPGGYWDEFKRCMR